MSIDSLGKYHNAVNFLEGLTNLPMVNDYMIDSNHEEIYIKRMRYFLHTIGNPEMGMKFIHITGTSGKGTVTNMVNEILLASGRNVGSFTSPYVTTSIEKIKVKDKFISVEEFSDLVEYLKPFIDKSYVDGPYGRPSYFEIFLAIAILYFKRKKCDFVVLEVGLGGRYDATNFIDKPLVTAITNIDYDHTEILGKTLAKIAFDKAGIIKPGSVFFTTEQRPSLIKIFRNICSEKSVKFTMLPEQDNYHEYNIKLAEAIAKYLNIDRKSISKGIGRAKLACRFEIVSKKPLVILDGAHNRSKIASTVRNLQNYRYKKLFLIIGIASDKDHKSILGQIVPLAHRIYYTRFQNRHRKCAQPNDLHKISRSFSKPSAISKINLDPEMALADALCQAKQDDLIIVTGSFFLAGELRKHWYPENYILKKRRSF